VNAKFLLFFVAPGCDNLLLSRENHDFGFHYEFERMKWIWIGRKLWNLTLNFGLIRVIESFWTKQTLEELVKFCTTQIQNWKFEWPKCVKMEKRQAISTLIKRWLRDLNDVKFNYCLKALYVDLFAHMFLKFAKHANNIWNIKIKDSNVKHTNKQAF
jgi:hypothetical protein